MLELTMGKPSADDDKLHFLFPARPASNGSHLTQGTYPWLD